MSSSVSEFVKEFTDENISYVELNGEFYLQNSSLDSISDSVKQKPYFKGLYLGKINKRKEFEASCALLELIAKKSKKKVYLDKKTEWLFLCGRDVFGQGIAKSDVNDREMKGQFVLIQNLKDENLGLGKIVDRFSNTEAMVIKNVIDRGSFLRREK